MLKTYKTIKEAKKNIKKNEIVVKNKNGYIVVKDIKSLTKKPCLTSKN
jgi:hypothetical protein